MSSLIGWPIWIGVFDITEDIVAGADRA